jgi:hypothetical protein
MSFSSCGIAGATVLTSGPLHRACVLTHDVSLEYNDGYPATCVLTSAALWEILERLGYPARMMRIQASIHHDAHWNDGVILGSFGDGTWRPASQPGMWKGHVGVVVGDVLLDPTLDQVNGGRLWAGATPMAVQFVENGGPRSFTDAFGTTRHWIAETVFCVPIGDNGAEARFTLFPNKCGWKSAGDFRAKYRRRPIVEKVLAEMAGGATLVEAALQSI